MSSSTKRNVVVAGLDDNKSTDNKKQKYQCGKKEKTPATITTDMKHALNDDKLDREEHWKELEAIRKLEEDYEEDPKLEEEDEDNEYESFDYDDLHLAYSCEKSPKETSIDFDFAADLRNLWVQFIDRTNDRKLFISELDGSPPSVMSYNCCQFLHQV
ncbi:hypothetical protein Tco_0471936 [Tanacetum coccineum]